jgi:hypothetical protein
MCEGSPRCIHLGGPALMSIESNDHPTSHVPRLVAQLYAIVRELESLFPGRRFTPDGHLVGSLGEVVAAHRYGLTLLSHSEPIHDAVDAAGRRVQVKVTQASSVALRREPSFLLVLRLLPNGSTEEIYNGPGEIPWRSCGPMQSNGQASIGLTKLKRLDAAVLDADRIRAPSLRSR